jgi:tetratricopeptide (TPR) repeat protein
LADIFVSYTSSDREWAHWVALELQRLGHVARVHEWEIKGGDDIYAWMERRHDAADHMLCVVSDEYLRAPFSTLERNAAFWRMAKDKPGFVLLVAVKPSVLPSLADHYRRCELFGIPKEAAQLRLRQFLEAPVRPEAVAFPGKVFAVSNIPIRVPEHFLGRDDALEAIDGALKEKDGRLATVALHGLRGVGKSTLAAAYAERHRRDYRATWWVRAEKPDSARADLVALGVRLGWVSVDQGEEPELSTVRERLRDEGEGLLLLYDNALDAASIGRFLPKSGAVRVLLTSNAPNWRGVATPIEVPVWPKEVGADYLVARTGRMNERADAEELSRALEGLTLAHEQAAAYCDRLGLSLAEYRKRFSDTPARLLDAAKDASPEYHGGLTVAKSFALAIEAAAKLHPAAEALISYAALLPTEPIPLFLFSEARERFGEPFASQIVGGGLDEAVAALRALALAKREPAVDWHDPSVTTDAMRLHRMVCAAAVARQPEEATRSARCILLDAITSVLPGSLFENPSAGPRFRWLLAHQAMLSGDLGSTEAEKQTKARLFSWITRPVYELELQQKERSFGAEHPETAASLRRLAGHVRDLDDFAGAQPLFERALAICETALGAEHPDTAMTLNNLGHLLWEQNDFDSARQLFERALAIREKVFGAIHADTAISVHNLATVLADQGHLEAAGPLLQRALEIWESTFGPDDAHAAIGLNSLGQLLHKEGDYDAARSFYERALVIHKALGENRSDTASTLTNLARLFQDIGELPKAEAFYKRAIAIRERVEGVWRSSTQRTKSRYARLLLIMDRPAEAFSLGDTALLIHDHFKGLQHDWTRYSCSVTADALDALGRADEAASLRLKYGIEAARA